MIEADRFEFLELPLKTDLENAVRLNKEIWKRRDKFLAISSSVEIPSKYTKPVFNRIFDKFADYIKMDRSDFKPVTGYSLLPEIRRGWNYGFYNADYGNYRPLRAFEEFSTDWLAQSTYGRDPLMKNIYLRSVIMHLLDGNLPDAEHLLLNGLFRSIKNKKVSRDDMTKTFASLHFSGSTKLLDELVPEFTNGERKNYAECLEDSMDKEKYADVIKLQKIKFKHFEPILKSLFFVANSGYQIFESGKGTLGLIVCPGVINLSGVISSDFMLAHEGIHLLGYHKYKNVGIPIRGYIMGMGIVLPN